MTALLAGCAADGADGDCASDKCDLGSHVGHLESVHACAEIGEARLAAARNAGERVSAYRAWATCVYDANIEAVSLHEESIYSNFVNHDPAAFCEFISLSSTGDPVEDEAFAARCGRDLRVVVADQLDAMIDMGVTRTELPLVRSAYPECYSAHDTYLESNIPLAQIYFELLLCANDDLMSKAPAFADRLNSPSYETTSEDVRSRFKAYIRVQEATCLDLANSIPGDDARNAPEEYIACRMHGFAALKSLVGESLK